QMRDSRAANLATRPRALTLGRRFAVRTRGMCLAPLHASLKHGKRRGVLMKKLALATIVAMGFTTAAVAQSPAPRPDSPVAREPAGNDRTNQVSFETADKNKDGTVNREEANQINGFDFSRADTNNDKTLTRQEFMAAMAKSTPRGNGVEPAQDHTAQT